MLQEEGCTARTVVASFFALHFRILLCLFPQASPVEKIKGKGE